MWNAQSATVPVGSAKITLTGLGMERATDLMLAVAVLARRVQPAIPATGIILLRCQKAIDH